MKLSMYNILTEKEDGTSILCNTHTLAVVALDQKHTKEYKLLDNGKEILDQEMLAQMFQAGLLINDDMNEKEALLALNKYVDFLIVAYLYPLLLHWLVILNALIVMKKVYLILQCQKVL